MYRFRERRGLALATLGILLTPICGAAATPGPVDESASAIRVEQRAGGEALLVGREVVRTSSKQLKNAELVRVPDTATAVALWDEADQTSTEPYYSVSLDGRTFATAHPAHLTLKLRHGDFNRRVAQRSVEPALQARAGEDLYIVQFITQPLEIYRQQIHDLGGQVFSYLPHQAHIVQMSPQVREAVRALPYVDWVGPYHPAYRLEEPILAALNAQDPSIETGRYRIQVFEQGTGQKAALADAISAIGGVVHDFTPGGLVVDATLTADQLRQVAGFNQVMFIDRWGPPVKAMNNVRIVGGADYLESVAGYTGAGVIGEVMDDGCQIDHPAFASRLTVRLGPPALEWHGTSTFGIVFGDGTGSATGRGMLPNGEGLFSMWGPADRYSATAPLATQTWSAVFQSNSWNVLPYSTEYNSVSSEMDKIVFDFDIVILQAQANNGTQSSAPEAWAKNVVSVGGIYHFNDTNLANDEWHAYASGNASIGPAADGRIKPDLCFWYDAIRTTTWNSGYTSDFGGTSAATPETAGHFGLFFQMWADGIFGNPVSGGTVFQERPHSSTARAVMINTASPYPFSGTTADLTRTHQGWGRPDVQRLYDLRNNMMIVDEDEVLPPFGSIEYGRTISAGDPALRATLVYTDIEGTTSSSLHRINDLSLKVTSPSGVIYYGNNGLLAGNTSTPGGSPNGIDPVENVWIESPEQGNWKIEVSADSVNEDGHVETPETDADFALVVSGGTDCPSPAIVSSPPPVTYACYGDDVTLTPDVSDYTSLQWELGGQPLVGETGPSLTIQGFSPADEGDYELIASNSCASRSTDPATVIDPGVPVITAQPVVPTAKCEGGTTYLEITATGVPPLYYQWYHNGVAIPDQVQRGLSIPSSSADDAGDYFCRVSNQCGYEVDSNTVGVSIEPLPVFVHSPEDACGEVGDTVVLTADATAASPLTYQWRKGTTVVGSGDTLVLDNLATGDAGDYRVLAFTSSPVCITYSDYATVTVPTSEVCPGTAGDLDGDGDYDLADMQRFLACFGTDVTADFCCACANVDVGSDMVDLADWAALESQLSGPE